MMQPTQLSAYSSYKIDTKVDPAAVTNYGGLFPYLDLMLLTNLPGIITHEMPSSPPRGWQAMEYVEALLALNLTGGDCVDDIAKLAADPGIALYMGSLRQTLGVQDRRFARGGQGVLPSQTCIREWLDQFHDEHEETKRQEGTAFIPMPNPAFTSLRLSAQQYTTTAWQLYQRSGRPAITRATLEIDATFMESQKQTALTCYKKFDAYSALTVRWDETGLVVWNQFRDGNVPPSCKNQDALTEAITYLNTSLHITDVWIRSDAAACQHDLLDALNSWQVDGRACPVRFAIGYMKTQAFRAVVRQQPPDDWHPVYDKQGALLFEVTEVSFVSTREAKVAGDPYRHIVVRRKTTQGMLPGLEVAQPNTADDESMEMGGQAYHIVAIISNIMDWTPQELVAWYNGRCGNGEAIHSILKSDLAGGQLPSKRFGANAAWWEIVVLAHNLHVVLALLALPDDLKGARFKRLRFYCINVPARLVRHARQCVVRYFHDGTLAIMAAIRANLRIVVPI